MVWRLKTPNTNARSAGVWCAICALLLRWGRAGSVCSVRRVGRNGLVGLGGCSRCTCEGWLLDAYERVWSMKDLDHGYTLCLVAALSLWSYEIFNIDGPTLVFIRTLIYHLLHLKDMILRAVRRPSYTQRSSIRDCKISNFPQTITPTPLFPHTKVALRYLIAHKPSTTYVPAAHTFIQQKVQRK